MGFLRSVGGQAMAEVALVVPMLFFVLIGGADIARAYALQLAVQNGARAGAEAVASDYFAAPTDTEAKARALDEMSRTPGMNAATAVVTAAFKQANGTSDCVDPPTIATPCFVTVRVRYTFSTLVPWPLMPNTANFDRSTTMRMLKKGIVVP